MDYEEAAILLHNGEHIRRKGWEKGKYIYLDGGYFDDRKYRCTTQPGVFYKKLIDILNSEDADVYDLDDFEQC